MKYEIAPSVWGKIVGSETPTIDKIMFAAALDPLLLVDLDMIQPPRSFVECVQLADMGTRGDLRSFLKGVLIQWVTASSATVPSVVDEIARWDTRLGVWCAAACAESVLRFVPEGEYRPRLAVEAAKGWVLGVVDADAVRAVAYAAADATAFYAATDAAYAAFYAAASAAADAADYAASAYVARGVGAGAAYASAAAARAADAARPAGYADADASRSVITHAIESHPVEQP